MNRRQFLKRGGLVLAGSTLLFATRQSNAASRSKKEKMRRIGCTTVCFRMRFPSTRPKDYSAREPDLTLLEVPAFFADKLGVHNVELWSRHFEQTSLEYCRKISSAAEKAASKIITSSSTIRATIYPTLTQPSGERVSNSSSNGWIGRRLAAQHRYGLTRAARRKKNLIWP